MRFLLKRKQNHPVTNQFEVEMVPVKGKFEGEKADFGLNTNYLVLREISAYVSI